MKYKKVLVIIWILFHFILIVSFDKNNNYLRYQNRIKSDFPIISKSSFEDYGNELEKSLIDRVYYNDELQYTKKHFDNIVYRFVSSNYKNKSYKAAFDTYYFYNNEEYLVDLPMNEGSFESKIKMVNEVAATYNNIKCQNKFLYYINTSGNVNFDNNSNIMSQGIKNSYYTYKFGEFEIKNYEEYKKYYYKTDFHWNDVASYKGYLEIMDLLQGDNYKINKPIERVKLSDNYYGSRVKASGYHYIKDSFYYNKFNLGEYKKYIDGVLVPNDKKYDADDLYSKIYGIPEKEIVYDFNNPDKDDLLILTNSFGFPISKLIASNYNKTYVIEPRLYNRFDANDYIKKRKINNVLVITAGILYYDERYKLKGD